MALMTSNPQLQQWLAEYCQQQKSLIDRIPLEQVERIMQRFRTALREDRQIFVFGNGGSAANASHFITDLGKGASDRIGRRFRCISLNECTSWMTALGNDYAYEDVFVRQIENYARPGDLAMALSVSGSSPNLVKAFHWCRAHGLVTIALVGGRQGKLAELADELIVIDSEHYGRVEDAQMIVCHLICYGFMENPQWVLSPEAHC